jgi:hypothetical protein
MNHDNPPVIGFWIGVALMIAIGFVAIAFA